MKKIAVLFITLCGLIIASPIFAAGDKPLQTALSKEYEPVNTLVGEIDADSRGALQAILDQTAVFPDEIISLKTRVIILSHNSALGENSKKLDQIFKRNLALKLLIGPEYKKVKESDAVAKQNSARIDQLKKLSDELKTADEKFDQSVIQEKITVLEQQNVKLINYVNKEENRFSLFGWIVKLFY